jgi:hypothetical protein
MKNYLLKAMINVVLALFFFNNLYSQQINIPETGISFKLKDSLWVRVVGQKDVTKEQTVYRYRRSAIETRDGKKYIPTIAVIVENVQDSDIVVYAAMKKVKTPLQVDEVITPGKGLLSFENAIAYRGGFTDQTDTRHSVTIIYLINKGKGVQIVMDITNELFEEYKGEFDEIIRSLAWL